MGAATLNRNYRTSQSYVLVLKTATFLFALLSLLVMIGTVLTGDYYTFALALLISLTGVLSLSNIPSLILLHCCGLVLTLVYGIVYVIMDATTVFPKLTTNFQIFYVAKALSGLTGFMFTVGMLTVYMSWFYRDLRKIKQDNNYV